MDLTARTAEARTAAYKTAPPWLADPGRTILLARAGSHAYGLAVPESDIDLRGTAIAPRAAYFGFAHRFESFTSKVPDCEVTDLRFFMRAAAAGEPNALLVLFCEEDDLIVCSEAGRLVRDLCRWFLSQNVVKPFAGNARSYIEKVRRSQRQDHGKSAMHALRLARMLREILVDERVLIRRPDADYLLRVRLGEVPPLEAVEQAEAELAKIPEWKAGSTLPDQPDLERLNLGCVNLVDFYAAQPVRRGERPSL